LDKKSGDFDRMSSTLNGIASVFSAAGKPEEAEKYILESIAANSLTDNLSRRAVLLGTASEIYRSLERKKESLDYAQQALNIERQLGDSTRISGRLSQVANAQLGLAKTEDAKHTLLEAMPM
jgi:tetratricopeptide (TPR) repeat protein